MLFLRALRSSERKKASGSLYVKKDTGSLAWAVEHRCFPVWLLRKSTYATASKVNIEIHTPLDDDNRGEALRLFLFSFLAAGRGSGNRPFYGAVETGDTRHTTKGGLCVCGVFFIIIIFLLLSFFFMCKLLYGGPCLASRRACLHG